MPVVTDTVEVSKKKIKAGGRLDRAKEQGAVVLISCFSAQKHKANIKSTEIQNTAILRDLWRLLSFKMYFLAYDFLGSSALDFVVVFFMFNLSHR